MKGIHVIAIALLACPAVITANQDSARDKLSVFEGKQSADEIPTKCSFYEKPLANSMTIHLAHENDCTKYYKCFLNKRIELECPSSEHHEQKLHFNTREQVCDWPSRAGCKNCPGDWWNGYPRTKISHESDDCDLYYECIEGKKHVRRCPNGLCFSRTCQACVRYRAGGNCD